MDTPTPQAVEHFASLGTIKRIQSEIDYNDVITTNTYVTGSGM
jgi:hypothetical protein